MPRPPACCKQGGTSTPMDHPWMEHSLERQAIWVLTAWTIRGCRPQRRNTDDMTTRGSERGLVLSTRPPARSHTGSLNGTGWKRGWHGRTVDSERCIELDCVCSQAEGLGSQDNRQSRRPSRPWRLVGHVFSNLSVSPLCPPQAFECRVLGI